MGKFLVVDGSILLENWIAPRMASHHRQKLALLARMAALLAH
jgi:hypothetical protein